MFYIADLIEPFLIFHHAKPTIDSLYKKKKNALEGINQTIYWRDLVLRPKELFGESPVGYKGSYQKDAKERLIDHIEFLFKLTTAEHRASFVKKPGCQFTRLTMPEFSLYTPEPFDEEEYRALHKTIESLAKQHLDPNVHVLLSSFSVRDKQGKILNMLMYVEPLQTHPFSKNTASDMDVDYGNQADLFTQQDSDYSFDADGCVLENGASVWTASSFDIKTVNDASCTVFIDACVDHALGHSRQQLERRINSSDNKIIPEQVEHCISSSSVELYPQNLVSDKVIHADTQFSSLEYRDNAKVGKAQLSTNTINNLMPNEYPSMTVSNNKGEGYEFCNPAFGSDFVIEILEERPAGKYLPDYQESISYHNESVIVNQIAAAKSVTLSDKEMRAWELTLGETTSQCILQHMEDLETKLSKICESNAWAKLFDSEEAIQKRKANQIIRESMSLIKEVIQREGNMAIFSIEPWKKDLLFKLNKAKISESLNQKLINHIELTITLMEYKLNVRLEKPVFRNENDFESSVNSFS